MERTRKWKRRKLFFIPIILIGVSLVTGFVMMLWNWLMPDIFGLTTITFWQALGLLVLSKILLGRHHFGRRLGGSPFSKFGGKNKFLNMSEEEKNEFKGQWKSRCGG